MARTLAGTTWRGRVFLSSGLVLFVVGLAAGEHQVLRIGVLALAVPLAGAVLLAGSRGGLSVTRALDRPEIEPGETAVLVLTVTNTGRVPVSGAVLVQPLTGPVVRAGTASSSHGTRSGAGARRRVGPLRAGEASTAVLSLTAAVRGRHDLPEAVVTVSDPFGMVRRSRTTETDAPAGRPTVLTFTPATTRLDGRPGDAPAGAAAVGRGRSVGVAGEQDSSVRVYTPGDDVRRVHWRSTAHRGELMVRQEEQPWHARLTVVLDTRGGGFTGDGPASTFEWAVSAAASVVEHAARLGYEVDLVADTGPPLPGGWTHATPGHGPGSGSGPGAGRGRPAGARGTPADRRRAARAALERLVDIHPRPAIHPAGPGSVRERVSRAAVVGAGPGGGVDTVVAVLGTVHPADLAELSELRTGRTTAIALLLDPDDPTGQPDVTGQLGTGQQGTGVQQGTGGRGGGTAAVVRAALAAQGWQTGVIGRADAVREAWDTARAAGRSGAGRSGAGRSGAGRSGAGRSGAGVHAAGPTHAAGSARATGSARGVR